MLPSVLLGFALAAFAPLVFRYAGNTTGWILSLLPLGIFAFFANEISSIEHGETVKTTYEWVPSLNVNLALNLDGLSLVFVLLISGIGTLVFIYGGGYLHGNPYLGRFYSYLLIFMSSMLGVVLADNIITLFIFWELTSISSYLLIGFYHDREISREAAKTALIVTGAGGLVLLAGLVLLGIMTETWTISAMKDHHEILVLDNLYLPMLILVLVGAATKSAQFPFHFWLPSAMEAPAPVSAYLHSATMVKAGVYLLARLYPIIGKTEEWHLLVTALGGTTMLVGGYLAWQQTDIKRILAYTTISALGILVFLLGIGTGLAIKGAMLFLIVHCLYKGALFMVGGIVDHSTGSRDIGQLSGLRTVMPITALAAGAAALSMSGIPPLIGFIAKEIIYEATLEAEDMPIILLTAVALLGNVFNVVAALMVAWKPFWGELRYPENGSHHGAEDHREDNHHQEEHPAHISEDHARHEIHSNHSHQGGKPHEASIALWLGPITLGVLSLVFGMLSVTVVQPVLEHTVASVYGREYHVELGLWHGFNATLLLSGITITLGLIWYIAIPRLKMIFAPINLIGKLSPEKGYHAIINGVLRVAHFQDTLISISYLRYFIRVMIISFSAVTIFVIVRDADLTQLNDNLDVRFYEWVLVVMMIVAAFVVTQVSSRLAAIATMGVIGYSVALIFILYGAPDLAMTQFAIETLTVILFVLVLYKLPRFRPSSRRHSRYYDGIIAITAGAIMTLLVLIITAEPLESRLTPYFAENSYLEAHGRNVVNVILVDFRGFDTMGEITVLSVAAIGVFALLSLNLNKSNGHKSSSNTVRESLEDKNETPLVESKNAQGDYD